MFTVIAINKYTGHQCQKENAYNYLYMLYTVRSIERDGRHRCHAVRILRASGTRMNGVVFVASRALREMAHTSNYVHIRNSPPAHPNNTHMKKQLVDSAGWSGSLFGCLPTPLISDSEHDVEFIFRTTSNAQKYCVSHISFI